MCSRLSILRFISALAMVTTTISFANAQELTFTQAGKIPTVYWSHTSIATADFDNDGDQDLLTVNSIVIEARVYINDGFGYFPQSVKVAHTLDQPDMPAISGAAATDVNGDGNIDILVIESYRANPGEEPHIILGRLVTFLNNGNAKFTRFTSVVGKELPDCYWALGDIDKDGDMDIAIHRFYDSSPEIKNIYTIVYKNDGTGFFTEHVVLNQKDRWGDIYLNDLNADGFKDLICGPSGNDTLSIWFNDGLGNFAEINKKDVSIESQRTYTIADLNNDGRIDIISDYSVDTLGIYIQKDFLEFQEMRIPLPDSVLNVTAGDFNNDGFVDIVYSNFYRSHLLLNSNGIFSFSNRHDFNKEAIQHKGIGVGDFDGDADLDIVFSNTFQVYLNADIQTNFIGKLCNTSTAEVLFSSTIRFGTSNEFTVELSDKSGDFGNSTIIGKVKNSSSAGKISATIPLNTAEGNGYLLRVNSTEPPITGLNNKHSISIQMIPLPLLGPDIVTCGEDTLLISNLASADSYRWNTPTNVYTNTPTVRATVSGDYVLTITKNDCTLKDTLSLVIAQINDINFAIDQMDAELFPDTLFIQFPVTFSFTAESEVPELIWDFNNGDKITGEARSETFHSPGNYRIKLLASNEHGCFSERSKEIFLTTPFFPNVITPNGDGKNESFYIKGANEQKTSVMIFNRWGEKIYENLAYDNNWSAEGLTAGVYYYKANMHVLNTKIANQGWLHVLK
jgi:gliding motility-associated-like protein